MRCSSEGYAKKRLNNGYICTGGGTNFKQKVPTERKLANINFPKSSPDESGISIFHLTITVLNIMLD